MENLELYNRVRAAPDEAKKTIGGGRLKGMTDINPMWRIQTLTKEFGICGIGWKIQIVKHWIDQGNDNEAIVNVEILLFIKVDGEWSEGIPAIGSSKIVVKETNGIYTDDEGIKKAYTDAISVACKMLGIGADVYWSKDAAKYTATQPEQSTVPFPEVVRESEINTLISGTNYTMRSVNDWIEKRYKSKISLNQLTQAQYGELVNLLQTIRTAPRK